MVNSSESKSQQSNTDELLVYSSITYVNKCGKLLKTLWVRFPSKLLIF